MPPELLPAGLPRVDLLPLALAVPILLWIAWTDFRYMRIRNRAVLLAVGLFCVTAPLVGLPEVGLRLFAATVVFLTGLALFAAGLLGGGDVKMAAALLLLIPSGTYTLFASLFSVALLIAILFVVGLRAVPALRRSGPVSLRARGTVPMGLAFALVGVLHLGALAALP